MSFAQEVKSEIAARRLTSAAAARAAAYGVACFGRYFDEKGVVLHTDSSAVAQYAQRAFALCGVAGDVLEKTRPSGVVYEFAVKQAGAVADMLSLFGHTGVEASLRIGAQNLPTPECVQAYVAAAFLCCGTITDPRKEYTLEFLSPRYNLSRDFEALLAEHEFAPHRTTRKGVNVIYVKASAQIEDLLTFMGAPSAAMELMNHKIYKDIRNKTNRLTNCETANLTKSAMAGAQTLRAIHYLQAHGGLTALPPPLRAAAEQRLAYPESSLNELAASFTPPLSKSGLSHRLKRLEALAQQMQERNRNA